MTGLAQGPDRFVTSWFFLLITRHFSWQSSRHSCACGLTMWQSLIDIDTCFTKSRETKHKHQSYFCRTSYIFVKNLQFEPQTLTEGDKSYDISFFLSSCQILHSHHLYREDNTMDKVEREEQISQSLAHP